LKTMEREVIRVLSNGSVLSRRLPALPPQDIAEGSYWTPDGSVARVRKSLAGRLYAERFNEVSFKFEYERGLVYSLEKRMTLDEARAWGARLGRCAVCGKTLTANKSVDDGIGPVCIKRLEGK
jgi:hypothetical protein